MSGESLEYSSRSVLITGIGLVTPLGIGREVFWENLLRGASGVRRISHFDPTGLPVEYGGEVPDFDPKLYVRPRKSLKVMSREIQFAFTAADLAMRDAGLQPGTVSPERLGVVFGADMIYPDVTEMIEPVRACMPGGRFEFELWAKCGLPAIYPLWLLKYLPNMPACHVAIANNAQAPCNSIILNEASGLVALTEGMRLIERGAADLVIVGGVGARLHPTTITFRAEQQLARGADDPASACRPFAIDRSGQVLGEGSGALVLEAAEHALARRATNYGKVAGYAIRHESRRGGRPFQGTALRTALRDCLRAAGCLAEQLSHVNAHGLGTREHDAVEAAAIRDALGQVPVTACKGALGNLGAGCGVVELAASLLAQQAKLVPATRNCSITDPDCAINIVRHEPLPIVLRNFVSLNFAPTGQAVAVCVESG